MSAVSPERREAGEDARVSVPKVCLAAGEATSHLYLRFSIYEMRMAMVSHISVQRIR